MISEIAKVAAEMQTSPAPVAESSPGKFEVPGTRDLGRTDGGPTGFDAKEISKLSDIPADITPDSDASDAGSKNNCDGIRENAPIRNKVEGLMRESIVEDELQRKYPEKDGYSTMSEVYLRNKDGAILKDPEMGEARRVDFAVVKDGKAVDMVEVTSPDADKTEQMAKEARIRDAGGNYIKDSNGNLVEIPSDVKTRIVRIDLNANI
jgi:hypothetical protein